MYDSVATFYGGYDSVRYLRRPSVRFSRNALILAVAGVVLLGFVAADVGAFANLPVSVQVTGVSWYAEGELLTTSGGFTLHSSQSTTLVLTCDTICWAVDGASVSAPFHLVGLTVIDQPVQYVNVTVQAPSTAYHGGLTIDLAVG